MILDDGLCPNLAFTSSLLQPFLNKSQAIELLKSFHTTSCPSGNTLTPAFLTALFKKYSAGLYVNLNNLFSGCNLFKSKPTTNLLAYNFFFNGFTFAKTISKKLTVS